MTRHTDVSAAHYQRWLALILLVGFLSRVALIEYAAAHSSMFDFPDSHRYVRVAANIAAGNGPIENESIKAGTDPVYPAILAIGMHLGFDSTETTMAFGRRINTLFGLAAIFFVGALGAELFSRRVGILAAAWCAVDPILLYFNALVLTELPYIAMLLAAVLLLARYQRTRRTVLVAIAGTLLGLATLTRSSALFLPFLLAGWLVLSQWRSAPRTKSMLAAGVLLLAYALAMSPMVNRNYQVLGAFVPVRTGSGASLLEALGPWADGGPGMDRIAYPPTPEGANEVERDRIYRRAAFDWAQSHLGESLRLARQKLARTWSITMNAPGFQSGKYAIICWLTVAPIFILAIFGVWRLRARTAVIALLLLPGAYFTLIHMVFVGSVRYRLPAMPFLFLLAAVTIDGLLRRRQTTNGSA